MRTITLYYGDNGVHDFWEDEHRRLILIANHRQPSQSPAKLRWFVLWSSGFDPTSVPAVGSPQGLARLIERRHRLKIDLNQEKVWHRAHPDQMSMVLIPAKTESEAQ